MFLAPAMLAVVYVLISSQALASDVAQEESVNKAVFVFIKIPYSIIPIERGEKYEDPVDDALTEAGVGEVTGGGSQLGEPNEAGNRNIEWVGIDIDLTDLANGIPLLKSELKRLGAPAGTTIEYELNGAQVVEAL